MSNFLRPHVCKKSTPFCDPCQVPLSTGILRQEHWSGLPCLPPGDLPDPGLEPRSPTLQEDSSPSQPQIRFGGLGQSTPMKQCWKSTLTTPAGSPSQYLRETTPSVYRGGLVGANRAEMGGDLWAATWWHGRPCRCFFSPQNRPQRVPAASVAAQLEKRSSSPLPAPPTPRLLGGTDLGRKGFQILPTLCLHYSL